jgi:excisionase family DNA binding protein
LGISRSRAYELIASGEIPKIRIGKSVRVPVEALHRWVRGRLAEEATRMTSNESAADSISEPTIIATGRA